MNRKTLLLTFISGFLYSSIALADTGIKKLKHANKTVYLAKSGISDDRSWDIRWGYDYAIAKSKVIYSEEQWDNTESSFAGKILSVVGPYLSYKINSQGYSEGAAHPWHSVYFKTINFVHGKTTQLTDIFNEDDVFQALLSDGVIKKALGNKRPANLNELLQQVDGGCDFSLTKSNLSSFVFHHIKNDRVAIRLGLGHGCEVMRGKFTQLGFYLNIPPHLKKIFTAARSKNLLMNRMIKLKY